MKENRNYPKAVVSDRAKERLKDGHPWVYDNELLNCEPFEDGRLVDVMTRGGKYIGTGFGNSVSKIRIRLISRNANDCFDDAFYRRRLQYAVDYRKTVMPGEDFSCCRLIFGEADSFPGLTVDRFSNLLSVQIASLAMEKEKDRLLPMLLEILEQDGQNIDGIYLRHDLNTRALEGLKQEKGWYWYKGSTPPSPTTEIVENGIVYEVDVENGQKTGFFLDQKYNRAAAARLAPGKTVLDCCTHTGSFALNAAKAGAKHVCALDVSSNAIEMAKRNGAKNGLLEKMSFEVGDVFEVLEGKLKSHDRSFDYIILDPPAFTKSRKTLDHAFFGYLELNTLAMRLLPRGGYLATCSCSHFMTEKLFRDMLKEARKRAGVNLRQIQFRQQSPDHPILLNVEETNYLKFFLLQVV